MSYLYDNMSQGPFFCSIFSLSMFCLYLSIFSIFNAGFTVVEDFCMVVLVLLLK